MWDLRWSLVALSRHQSRDGSHADDDEIKPANIQTAISAWWHGHAFTSDAASCCGNRGALSPWPRTHECTCNMACLRVTITRHESNKVSITLVGISCGIGGCPFPSAGDNAQAVEHSFRWSELPCASTVVHTCAEAHHHLVVKAKGFKRNICPCQGTTLTPLDRFMGA